MEHTRRDRVFVKKQTTRTMSIIGILVLVFTFSWFVFQHKVNATFLFAQDIRKHLNNNNHFTKLTATASTAGTVDIIGEVCHSNDIGDLKSVIEDMKPPVSIAARLYIRNGTNNTEIRNLGKGVSWIIER
jgi:hypothetical protein